MKNTKFIYSNTDVYLQTFDESCVSDRLKSAVYQMKYNKFVGFYLTLVSERFTVPEVIYGSMLARVNKVAMTYEQRPSSTGVLLSGDKGSGKTMMASLICNRLIESGVPVILINEPFAGTDFIEFLNDVGEAVLFFDEFGKTYSDKNTEQNKNSPQVSRSELSSNTSLQNDLLSLFDGSHSSKRLILMTENDTRSVNSFMINRPGRIYYHFKYHKLDEDMVVEYCESQGVPENVIKQIKSVRVRSFVFSFDILVAIVAEWKHFGDNESNVEELIADLNVPQGNEGSSHMLIEEVKDLHTGNKLFVHAREINKRFPMPDRDDHVGDIDYFMSEELSTDNDGDYNYSNELTYTMTVSDIIEQTLTHTTFLDRRRGHAFKFRVVQPLRPQYFSAF